MNAAVRTDGGGDEAAPTFVPSKEWLDTYLAQATSELIEFAKRYARARSRKVKLLRNVDESYSEELVVDVLGDTLLGVIAWDPERVSLKKHVLDAIKSRTRHDYVHALKFRPVRLEDAGVMSEVENALAEAARHDDNTANMTTAVIDGLRELARGDDDVMLLLDALGQLVTKKRDVIKLTGLNQKRYDAARKRLHRLTLELPAGLRVAAFGNE